MKYSYNFMQFWYGSLINLPKNLGKKHKTDKNILKIVIFHNFEYSSRLIPTIKQKKHLRMEPYVTLLSFHALLI